MPAITHLSAESTDPRASSAFWADVPGVDIRFAQAAAPKTVKNRVHLDLWVPDEDELIARGAVRLADHGRFRVFVDPDGNEFRVG